MKETAKKQHNAQTVKKCIKQKIFKRKFEINQVYTHVIDIDFGNDLQNL